MKLISLLMAAAVAASTASAQSPSPDDIKRMLDEQAATPNPYAQLLNDPDPKRSIGAMKIMMESGDEELISLAKEFGVLSSNPEVQRAAVAYYMATEPLLPLIFIGKDIEDDRFEGTVVNKYQGMVDTDRRGFAKLHLGKYNEKEKCFQWADEESCGITINSDGIFFFRSNDGYPTRAKLSVTSDGMMAGYATFHGVDDPFPMFIRLLD